MKINYKEEKIKWSNLILTHINGNILQTPEMCEVYEVDSEFPLHILDTVEMIYNKLDVPHLSLDFAYDGKKGAVQEF